MITIDQPTAPYGRAAVPAANPSSLPNTLLILAIFASGHSRSYCSIEVINNVYLNNQTSSKMFLTIYDVCLFM